MLRKQILLALYCLLQGAYFIDMGPKNSGNYGPYDIKVTSFEVIKGPKQKSIATINFSIDKQNGDYYSHTNLTFLEQGRIEQSKIIVYSVKDNRKTVLWTYRLNEPCTHFSLAPVIEHYLHSKNCVVMKGVFLVDLNYSEAIRKFFGTSFFYGNYAFKTFIFSKNANVLGLSIAQSFTKKNPDN